MKRTVQVVFFAALLLSVCGYTECYKRAGRGDGLPNHIKTMAIPPFQNPSLRYKVEQRFTSAMIDEALRRGRSLNVVSSIEGADAVLNGDIRQFRASGSILDNQGRTRVWDVRITVSVLVRDLKANKILFENPRMTFEGEYQLSDDPQTFFNEENPAVDRIARDFAQTIVSTIMEGL